MLPVRGNVSGDAHIAQLVEHILGKDEVTGSSPVVGSILCIGSVIFVNHNYKT